MHKKLTSSTRIGQSGSVTFKVDFNRKFSLYTWKVNIGHKMISGKGGMDAGVFIFPQIRVEEGKVVMGTMNSFDLVGDFP